MEEDHEPIEDVSMTAMLVTATSTSTSTSSSRSVPTFGARAAHGIASTTPFMARASSSSSSSSSSLPPTQLDGGLAAVQQELAETKAELATIKADIGTTKKRRNDLRARGDPNWEFEEGELKQLRNRQSTLESTAAELRDDIRQLRARDAWTASFHDIGSYDAGEWPRGTGHAGGAEFDLFSTTGLLPAALPPGALDMLLTPTGQRQFASVPWQKPSSSGVHLAVLASLYQFVRVRHSAERTEAADHFRNDALLHILAEASTTQLYFQRDCMAASASDLSRPDCHLSAQNRPPYVLIEEKASDQELNAARNDLTTKFRWIKHYDSLPFVFAIAIGGNKIEFGSLNRAGTYKAFPGPGGQGDACFRTSEVGSIAGALTCVHAAINIGRYVRFLDQVCPPNQVGVADFNTTIVRPGGKTMRITFGHVVKTYSGLTEARKARMIKFYNGTRLVPCLEKGVVLAELNANDAFAKNAAVKFKLTPVGVMQFADPRDANDTRRCVRDVLTALSGAHEAGWVIVDVREPNIICARERGATNDRYYVIDACEFAREVGDELPSILARLPRGWPDGQTRAESKFDLLMLAQILAQSPYAEAIDAMANGAEFRAMLGTGDVPAKRLLEHGFLAIPRGTGGAGM